LRVSEKGGSTDRNYVDAEGNKGSYLEFARVLGAKVRLVSAAGILSKR